MCKECGENVILDGKHLSKDIFVGLQAEIYVHDVNTFKKFNQGAE